MKNLLVASLIIALLSACSSFKFPGVHRIRVQQGNVITQAMIDKLKPGMTKSQVRFVLGNAIVDDSLNLNRWDYIYTMQIPGFDLIQTKLKLYFVDERLSYFEGDYVPTNQSVTADLDG